MCYEVFRNNLSSTTYHSEQVILQLVTMKLVSATFVVMLPLFWAAVGPDPSGKRHLPPASECARGCVGDCVKNSFVPVAQKNEGDPPNDEAKYLTQNRPPPRRSSGTLPSFSLALPPTNCSTCEVGENVHWIVDVETERCEVPCRDVCPISCGRGYVGWG